MQVKRFEVTLTASSLAVDEEVITSKRSACISNSKLYCFL